MLSYKPG